MRRIFGLAVKDQRITHNPAAGVGQLISRVARSESIKVPQIVSWTRTEADTLLHVANEHEPEFAHLLRFPLSTGTRRSEAPGLRWEDVDFYRGQISIRRALTKCISVTPKSGRSRTLAMPPTLASALFDLAAQRRQQCLPRSWPEVPPWVFCSKVGTPMDERNVTRCWDRVRRRAQRLGVPPLKLHTARHTFASLALNAGRSIRWVADQLGHATPALTLRVYAHVLPVEEQDLAFAHFDGSERLYPAPASEGDKPNEGAPGLSGRGCSGKLEHETIRTHRKHCFRSLTLARRCLP